MCFQLNLQVEYCLSLGITDLGHKAIISRNRSSAHDFFEELERWKRYLDSNMIVNKVSSVCSMVSMIHNWVIAH